MSLHDGNREIREVYFCTITCFKWLNLFKESEAYHSVYRWFNHLKADDCFVLGYVIMPNHLHALLYPTKAEKPLSMLVGEGKRFMAYDIVKALKQQGKDRLLAVMQAGVAQQEKQKGKLHQVFRLSFDARKCYSEKMIEQKLDYIHYNPVRGKWKLADDFAKYQHSSAGFYEFSEQPNFELLHYKDVGM
jgi:REP element-mobilizing transposase RayT